MAAQGTSVMKRNVVALFSLLLIAGALVAVGGQLAIATSGSAETKTDGRKEEEAARLLQALLPPSIAKS